MQDVCSQKEEGEKKERPKTTIPCATEGVSRIVEEERPG